MKNKPNEQLVASYLSGECSTQERAEIEAWLQSDPKNKQLLEFMKSIWNSQRIERQDWKHDQLWKNITNESGITAIPIFKNEIITICTAH